MSILRAETAKSLQTRLPLRFNPFLTPMALCSRTPQWTLEGAFVVFVTNDTISLPSENQKSPFASRSFSCRMSIAVTVCKFTIYDDCNRRVLICMKLHPWNIVTSFRTNALMKTCFHNHPEGTHGHRHGTFVFTQWPQARRTAHVL